MAAGLGFIEFTTGDVLTAVAANGYLASQVVMVFADSAARTTAITSPQEGMISFLKDTNAVEAYDGAAWVGVGGGSSPLTTKGDLYTFSTTDARLAVGTNGQVLVADSAEATGLKWATAGSDTNCAVFIDEKPSGTDGGTFTSGAWRTRDINTTQFNDITSASISSNQITLPAGTYKITAYAPAFGGDRTRSRFYNVTDSAVAINGLSAINNTGTLQYINIVEGLITIASSKTFELQHIINVTQAGNGFGVGTAAFSTPEVYSTVSIMKVG